VVLPVVYVDDVAEYNYKREEVLILESFRVESVVSLKLSEESLVFPPLR
jgi:hypothetical protein